MLQYFLLKLQILKKIMTLLKQVQQKHSGITNFIHFNNNKKKLQASTFRF